ncbi:MAG: DUF308 domain-containing protein [Erysipelotrichaceae bacterium]|nr:DUF308 domain-containing protein [Erysipelotrichaceae bacterium]MDY5253016.1 DUF308 domain-containing protein [Erysipelotrichaceae bacterium]
MNYIIYSNKNSRLEAILSIIIGLILLFMPGLTGYLVIMTIGVLFIAWGIIHLITYFRMSEVERNFIGLSGAIIPIVIGILIMLFWDFILGFLPLVIGLIIVVNSVFTIPSAIEQIKMKRYIDSILSCFAPLIIGALIISNAFGIATFAISLFGIVLVAGGIIKLIN